MGNSGLESDEGRNDWAFGWEITSFIEFGKIIPTIYYVFLYDIRHYFIVSLLAPRRARVELTFGTFGDCYSDVY